MVGNTYVPKVNQDLTDNKSPGRTGDEEDTDKKGSISKESRLISNRGDLRLGFATNDLKNVGRNLSGAYHECERALSLC